MAKVGLKDTLALLAKGYSKKEIDALAAVDEENDANPAPDPVPEPQPDPQPQPEPQPEPQPDKKEEPDYKSMYEELLKKNKESEAKITKLQQQNVNKNSAPDAAKIKEQEQESLTKLFASFM